ncbi:MAG: hypothetical protein K0S71_2507 [Clostridia bacterium]|jgi:parvulin-like peptidyl-prolyl isomerase|nr:hypothetical protein [Clostridia bacterium]
MKCNECGNINSEEQEYCKECGEKLGEPVVSELETDALVESNQILSQTEESAHEVPAKLNVEGKSKGKNLKGVMSVIGLLIIGTFAAVYLNNNTMAKKPETENQAATQESAAAKTEAVKREVIVTLDKEVITEPLFNLYFWITQQRFESAGPNVWEMDSSGKTIDLAKESTIKDMKLSVAAKNKAQELGIELSEEEKKSIQDQASEIITSNADLITKLQVEKQDMEGFITHGLYVQKVIESIGEGYTPTEEEVNVQMEQIKAQYETATVKHVLIGSKDEKGKALADEVLKKALAGEDMAALAKTYSEDPGSKDQGGEYTFPKGQMVPEFENASFTGEIGKVYPELVETSYGYHIIKVEKRETGDPIQIKSDSENAAKTKYAQDELIKLSEKISVKTTDLYNTKTIIK